MAQIVAQIGLGILLVVSVLLVLWQGSNIFSAWLGAPAVGSPNCDFLPKFASPDKTFLDLGCGSGTIVRRAAPCFKHVYGIEYSPWYYWLARLRSGRLANVTITYGNILTTPWPRADVIYCYLLPSLLQKVKTKLPQKATIVSLGFPIEGWRPQQTISAQPPIYVYYR